MHLIQIISLAGAALILVAFTLQLQGKWSAQDLRYLVCNVIGALTLTAVAYIEQQWGFLLMESVWTLVSIYGLIKRKAVTH
ncbi:CBU_0592 family membrane protein [Stenotrophobium rhamnosiphilum]|nr:hypothetical protein [Stenotrophobium rhamnosiphilum]